MTKVFIDGKEGTTGLKIYSRFANRDDIELLPIDEAKRKDPAARAEQINAADVAFLCLPDAAAREAVGLVHTDSVILIDTSTAHRTAPGWAYGFAELSGAHRATIEQSRRIAVPGCYASGFNAIVYPLIAHGIIAADYPVVCYGLSGYTGAGKKGIAQYENPNRDADLDAPRLYALGQSHKHLKEMQAVSRLAQAPFFSPIICDYPQGMVVSVPLFTKEADTPCSIKSLYEMFAAHYGNSPLIQVRRPGYTENMLSTNAFAGRDDMEIEISGNDERILITARFDNLGKGASGAAIQCMNIALGLPETTGLEIGE